MSYFPFTLKVEKDGGEFHSWCPEIEGCHRHGTTANLALENLKDAIHLYIDTMMEEEIKRQTAHMSDKA